MRMITQFTHTTRIASWVRKLMRPNALQPHCTSLFRLTCLSVHERTGEITGHSTNLRNSVSRSALSSESITLSIVSASMSRLDSTRTARVVSFEWTLNGRCIPHGEVADQQASYKVQVHVRPRALYCDWMEYST